jgi:hypothetical protein
VFEKLKNTLASLNLGLWLMAGVMVLLAVGSFVSGGEGASINDLPLLVWIKETPLSAAWWLWFTIALLALLVLNTVLCSIDSLRRKYQQGNLLLIIAPQVMHLGFLFIVLAHLFSAWGGFKQAMVVRQGEVVRFPDGALVQVVLLQAAYSPKGFPIDYSGELRQVAAVGEVGEVQTISPNHPFFLHGFGIYLKEVELYPEPAALIEIHREPGARWALVGALLFTVGNVVMLAVRRGK